MSQNTNSNLTLQQFIDSNKTQYGTQKGIQASNEYLAIISPYVQQIIELQKQIKTLEEKLPRKERVKIVKKGKK